jgi:hypothetical protein
MNRQARELREKIQRRFNELTDEIAEEEGISRKEVIGHAKHFEYLPRGDDRPRANHASTN